MDPGKGIHVAMNESSFKVNFSWTFELRDRLKKVLTVVSGINISLLKSQRMACHWPRIAGHLSSNSIIILEKYLSGIRSLGEYCFLFSFHSLELMHYLCINGILLYAS